jgi:hypothetical protein
LYPRYGSSIPVPPPDGHVHSPPFDELSEPFARFHPMRLRLFRAINSIKTQLHHRAISLFGFQGIAIEHSQDNDFSRLQSLGLYKPQS